MTEPVVRAFERADQAAARALILEGLGEHFGFIDASLNPDLDDIHATFIDGGFDGGPNAGHLFLVAAENDQVIGTAGLLFEAPGTARLVRMSVAVAHRRRGIALMLLNDCKQSAAQRGARELQAHTQPEWDNAVNFYLAQGFVQYGRDPIDIHLRIALS